MLAKIASTRLSEQRKYVRVSRDNKAAVIYGAGGLSPIMCTVTDISEGGAGLTVATMNGVPNAFELEIKGEQARRSCTVVWKKSPHRLGVSFADT